MKIISLRWKAGSSDFVHVIANDDTAAQQFAALRGADTLGQFDIAVCQADRFAEALDYVQTETASLQKDLA